MFIIGTGSTRAAVAAEVAEERHAGVGRGGLRDRQRDAEHRVRAEPRSCSACRRARSGAVDRRLVDARPGRRAPGRGPPLTLRTALRARPCRRSVRVAVTQLDRFVLSGRRAGGHCRAPDTRPSVSATSTSTVGLPRESRICRAATLSMALIAMPPSPCRSSALARRRRGSPTLRRSQRPAPPRARHGA